MAPLLYMIPASPPVRAVQITAKAIGLTLREKVLDLLGGEHLKPEFLKLNPQHTVPVLVDDDGYTLADSHAISAYIVSKYAKNDALYPSDLKKKGIVDQRLHFHSGIFFPRLLRITRPLILNEKNTVDQVDRDDLIEAYGFLDAFLQGNKWVAGHFLSIADYSLATSVSTINIIVPIDAQQYPNVTAWLKRVQQLPEFEENKKGHIEVEKVFKSKLGL